MARITGTIDIDFQTDKSISQEQFRDFKRKFIHSLMDEFELQVFDAASDCGFEADEIHPILLDYLECDFDEDEEDEN